MNQENLQPVRTEEEAREKGRAGGIASGKARREKKLFKEAIEKKLGGSLDSIIDSMIEQSQRGNVQATTFLRDTIGEKPTDKVEADIGTTIIKVDVVDE